jgi:hypothetical protein
MPTAISRSLVVLCRLLQLDNGKVRVCMAGIAVEHSFQAAEREQDTFPQGKRKSHLVSLLLPVPGPGQSAVLGAADVKRARPFLVVSQTPPSDRR